MIAYYVSEGPDQEFRLLQGYPISPEDLENIRLLGVTGGPQAALDVRITDFHIRAESLPNLPAATRQRGAKVWLMAAELVGLVITLVFLLSLGLWLSRRQNRGGGKGRSSTAGEVALPESFRCSGCGKDHQVKADLAGKKVKCSQCGTVGVVPTTNLKLPSVAPASERSRLAVWKKWRSVGATAFLLAVLAGGWFLGLYQPKRPSPVNVTLGCEYVAGVEESGIYCQEQDSKGQLFRWTDGHARLVIPLDKTNPPQTLWARLFIFRPPLVTRAPLKILVNNRELFDQEVPLWKWEGSFDLSQFDLGEELVLEIISDTFIPQGVMDGGTNEDPRTLGVQLRSIKLLSPLQGTPER
jgi:hypothetical protein